MSVGSRAGGSEFCSARPTPRPKDHCLSPPTFIIKGYKNHHLGRTHKGKFQGQSTRSLLLHWIERHGCNVQQFGKMKFLSFIANRGCTSIVFVLSSQS